MIESKELESLIEKFIGKDGKHDWDFSREALISQLILDIRSFKEVIKSYFNLRVK